MLKRSGNHVCRHVCANSVRSFLEPYSRHLISRGYAAIRVRSYVRVLEHFGRWIGRRHVSQSLVEQFLDKVLPACQCLGVSRYRRRNRAALNHFLAMLGLDRETSFSQGWRGKVLRRYQEHLVKVRGLAPATIHQHLRYTRRMLDHLGIRRASQFMSLTPEKIEKYASGVGRFAPSKPKSCWVYAIVFAIPAARWFYPS